MQRLSLLIVCSLLASAPSAVAQTVGARSGGMGGTGVASSDYLSAGFHNPARLTSFSFEDDDDWGLMLPNVGVGITDPDSLLDKLEDFEDSYDAIERTFNGGGVPTQAQLNRLARDLRALDGETFDAEIDTGLAIGIPSETLGLGLYVNGYTDVSAFIDIAAGDSAAIIGALGGGALPALNSEAIAVGAVVTEAGLAVAKVFEFGEQRVSLGVTPKFQRIEVINFAAGVDESGDLSSDYDSDANNSHEDGINLDLGATWEASESWDIGLAVRDVLAQEIDTPRISGRRYTYHLGPVVTAGAAWHQDFFTLTADLDLTQRERFKIGDESQFLRVGAETAWEWAQLRVGYRYDIEDGTEDMVSAGIGLSPFGVFHLDLAGAFGSDTYGAMLALSFTF